MSSVRKASKPSAGAPPIITRAPRPFCLLGIIAEYARHTTPITLRFSEGRHSFFKDVMNITDAVTNALVFRVEVKAFSLSGKKTLIDHAGRRLFDFYRAGGGLSTTYQGESCDETKKLLFTVDKIGTSESELFIAFDNLAADGRRQRWSVKGRWLPGVSQIANMSGLAVANISRDFSDFCSDTQTLEVTVAPGVDAALVSALCVCFEEAYRCVGHSSSCHNRSGTSVALRHSSMGMSSGAALAAAGPMGMGPGMGQGF